MINSIEICNFRGLEHVRVNKLRRLNVFVGPNGTGKTAFLEAIFIACGSSPELVLRTRGWRGRETEINSSRSDGFESIWKYIFRDWSIGSATIKIEFDVQKTRALEIQRTLPLTSLSETGEQEYSDLGVKFVWDTFGNEQEVVPKWNKGKLEFGLAPSPLSINFCPARVNISEAETARAYSRLRLANEEKQFEDAFQKEFPFLSDLSVEAPAGPPAIYAKMPSGRRLPLSMISGGINQLAGLMLRLAADSNSIILIDEIENGFYHERYGSIWRALYDLAVHRNGQIFATTHSLECLKALKESLHEYADEVRFIRSRLEENEVSFEELGGETLFHAVELGEVR